MISCSEKRKEKCERKMQPRKKRKKNHFGHAFASRVINSKSKSKSHDVESKPSLLQSKDAPRISYPIYCTELSSGEKGEKKKRN